MLILQTSISPRGSGNSSSLLIGTEVGLETITIDANAMTLDVSFNLTVTWNESRVNFANLKKDSTLNVIPASNASLWVPSIAFTNTANNAFTKVDDQTLMYVKYVQPNNDVDDSASEFGNLVIPHVIV